MNVKRKNVRRMSKSRRLKIVRELLYEVVSGIRSAQETLQQSDEPSNADCIVVAALGRLGWISEQCNVMAGDKFGSVVGTTDGWLLGPRNVLAGLRDERREELRTEPLAAAHDGIL